MNDQQLEAGAVKRAAELFARRTKAAADEDAQQVIAASEDRAAAGQARSAVRGARHLPSSARHLPSSEGGRCSLRERGCP